MFDLGSLSSELDSVVAEATTFADLVDKYADFAADFASKLPVVGGDAAAIVLLVDGVTNAINALNAALNG